MIKGSALKDKLLFKFLDAPFDSRQGITYHVGKITCPRQLETKIEFQVYGLTFVALDHFMSWLGEGRLVAMIKVDDDEDVYCTDFDFRTRSFHITSLTQMEDCPIWNDEQISLAILKMDPGMLQFVKCQTQDMCLDVVKQNGMLLQFVIDQTEDVCLAAVTQAGWALKFVKNQTDLICEAAVRENALTLELVQNQTRKICMMALTQNKWTRCFLKCLSMIKM